MLNPTFAQQAIKYIDKNAKMSRAYDGTTYVMGIVGLNNIKANDYCNVILQVSETVPVILRQFLFGNLNCTASPTH